MREIEKLIRFRHGNTVPETEDGLIYVEVISGLAFVQYGEEFVKIVHGWCGRWLPWASKHKIETIIFEHTKVRFSPLSADALGHALHVSYAERVALDLRTIGAHDVSKRARAKIQRQKRRERDRARKEAERRAAGIQTRSEYLANAVSQKRPWENLGICRRTWERRGKPMPGFDPKSKLYTSSGAD